MNLLIVDDEPMALEEIREVVLEVKNDICVKCCDNYMDALENAKIKKYDVAFFRYFNALYEWIGNCQKFKRYK